MSAVEIPVAKGASIEREILYNYFADEEGKKGLHEFINAMDESEWAILIVVRAVPKTGGLT